MNISVKLLILGLVLVTLVSAQDFKNRIFEQESEEDITSFNDFIKTFNRVFKTDSEFIKRFHIFKRNKKIVEELKLSDPESTMGITKFSDLTEEEFSDNYLNKDLKNRLEQPRKSNNVRPEPIKLTQNLKYDSKTPQSFITQIWNYFFPQQIDLASDSYPDSFDWKDQGMINPVVNQGTCGSCWAFATVSTLEAQVAARNNGKKVKLSEQQLLDCDDTNSGCDGGSEHRAYEFIQREGGMQTEQSYGKYREYVQHQCHSDRNENLVKIISWEYIEANEEKMKQNLFSYGPLSVGMSFSSLQQYRSGIYAPLPWGCDGPVNHAVMIVGYGVDFKGRKFWNIKNTHGSDWGEKGYFRIIRGINACKINSDVTQPWADLI